MTARDNTAPLPKRVPARVPEAVGAWDAVAYRLPPAADGSRHAYTELDPYATVDDALTVADPAPVWPLEVQLALAMLVGKTQCWEDRGQLGNLDKYLAARSPGHHNRFGGLRWAREFNDEVVDAAGVLTRPAMTAHRQWQGAAWGPGSTS